ncbi:MAG TPA: MoxR family ATPase [Ktedonobacterales bacterium]|nr:MoxR family ATPase [Ktedonobacterales bacterium]
MESSAEQSASATPSSAPALARVRDIAQRVRANVSRVIVGKEDVIDLLIVAILCEGHVLIEDVPGMGKTMMARALARSIAASFARVQGTPDLLPSDIVGVSYYNQRQSAFEFRRGPIFSNVVLVDEINRATPRTQSALLEAMQERQVTVDGETMPLTAPFLVIATQNPIELEGTFPLPEAQLDRFLLRLRVTYPTLDEELAMLYRFKESQPLDTLQPVISGDELVALLPLVRAVRVNEPVARYLLDVIHATRDYPAMRLGASPRASLALFRAAQALAAMQGRDYVKPDDIKRLAAPTLAHRLLLSPTQMSYQTQDTERLLRDIIDSVPAPVERV